VDSTEVNSYSRYNRWKETVKLFNSKIGQEVTRKELHRTVKHIPRKSYPTTLDNYKAILMQAGYVRLVEDGIYFVVSQIPEVSLTVMRKYVEDKRKPFGWFKYWGTLDEYLEYQRSKICS